MTRRPHLVMCTGIVLGMAALVGAQSPGHEAVHLLRVPHGGIQPIRWTLPERCT